MIELKPMNAYVLVDLTSHYAQKEEAFQKTASGIIIPTQSTMTNKNRIGVVIDISPVIEKTSLRVGEKVVLLPQGGYEISNPDDPDSRIVAIHHNDILCRMLDLESPNPITNETVNENPA